MSCGGFGLLFICGFRAAMEVSQNVSKSMKIFGKQALVFALGVLSVFLSRIARAEDDYVIGDPTLKDIWVDPVHGADGPGRGTTRATALKTVRYAWAYVPQNDTLKNTGFRIFLAPGAYPADDVPTQFQSAWGTADYPVIFQAADDTGSVTFPSVDVALCNHFYMIGVRMVASHVSYVSTFRACDHLLFRKCQFLGTDSTTADTAIFGASLYQSQHVHFEECEITRTSGSGIDLFATQYGHIKNCRIHHIGENAIYLRGGSGYMAIEENTISFTGKAGILCSSHDTTSGLDNLAMPWVHYDVYDVKCYNNIIDHTHDAGFSCSGGYNMLFAHNTLYQTGLANSLIVLNLASHACSRDKDVCHERIDSGAWGTYYYDFIDSSKAPIPNKNIFIYNNIFYNTIDSQTAFPHFSVAGPLTALAFNASCPKPAFADENVQIKGNIIWNGKPDKQLGISENTGCGPSNPTCNETQLTKDNLINAAEPTFVGASSGNFHPEPASIVFTVTKAAPVPDFSWTGLPPKPQEPAGNTNNTILLDRDSNKRNAAIPISGAFSISTSSVKEESPTEIFLLQNYPNPSKGITRITFRLLLEANVNLDIYDLLGEKISSLISSRLGEGVHSVTWNTANLPSGKYFCRISTANTTMTKQITVAR